ncbi:MAG: VCBS repeat-containing protein [Verrucomicrobiales bacterium]|nr:VCBS repeat-containing protein [Verrucomicrobiales bacterium]
MPRFAAALALLCLGPILSHVIAAYAAPAPAESWQQETGRRYLAVQPVGMEPAFTRLKAADIGIHWTNRCSPARYAKRQNLMNGAGVALGDYDGDGWCDIYLCNREGANGLFRNLGGWRFTNVTEQAGVAATNLISSGALFADLNGDGLLDLHVTSFLGPDALYFNRGDGTFTNGIDSAGVSTPGAGTSSAAADLDGDGDLDLYVARFAAEALLRDGSLISTRMVAGQPVVAGRNGRRIRILNDRLYELGEPDFLFLNQGQGRFTPVSWKEYFVDESGQPLTETPMDLGFSVQLRDVNGDSFPDIYVCNDFQTPDRCWINDGKGRFRALSSIALRTMSYASMGVDFADIDRDGHLDFYTLEMLPGEHFRHLTHVVRGADPGLRRPKDPLQRDAVSRSILAWNRGDGTYAEIAWFAGVATSDWSWTPIFLDVDLDGYEDLLISSGYPHDVNDLDASGGVGRGEGRRPNDSFTDQLLRYPPLDSPHIAWRNRGDLTFEDRSTAWGFDFKIVSHGMALADLDNDGDLDVVGNAFNGPPWICRNNAAKPRLAIRLKGRAPNTQAASAHLRVRCGSLPPQEQEMLVGGRYLSCDQGQRTFAAGNGLEPLELEIRWRDGATTRLQDLRANRIYEIDAPGTPPESKTTSPSPPPRPSPWFSSTEIPAAFLHQDPATDEFSAQPLLPWRQSFQGPGVMFYDLDQDGREDLLVGNGRGGKLMAAKYQPGDRGSWEPLPFDDAPLPDDALGWVGFSSGSNQPNLLVALANYESKETQGPAARRFQRRGDKWIQGPPVPATDTLSSPGSMAAGDVDGDGDIDLVIAGRLAFGRYPEPVDTRLYLNDQGSFNPAPPHASEALHRVGLVTGVLLTDLLGDPRPELVLACEWGPLRVFAWESDRLVERTADLGLTGTLGLWQGLAAADFDGDGRMDLAAANWGRNSYQQRAPGGPWHLYYGDLDGDGHVSVVETMHHPDRKVPVPLRTRDQLATELRWLPAAFPKHADFARASMEQILGEHATQFRRVEATTLASFVFLNHGKSFEAVELPRDVQWTPVFGFAAADFDGDGDVDLFAPQNFFDIREEEDRMDSGRGLLLANDGKGRFTTVPSQVSGIEILGEQRGAAIADFDQDGRIDLAVSQNSGPPVVLRNRHAPPGLRVRLVGTASNPDAIGARVRLVYPHGMGPVHEVRAGSGRMSQDAFLLVLARQQGATAIWVHFPGHDPKIHPLSASAPQISITAGGEVSNIP